MPQPEAYIGNAAALFDDKGTLINESTREFMQKFLQAFAQWIERNAPTLNQPSPRRLSARTCGSPSAPRRSRDRRCPT